MSGDHRLSYDFSGKHLRFENQGHRHRLQMESDDQDLPASYLFYIIAVMVAIAVAGVSTFLVLFR
jgi:hypothetical protein